MNKEKKEKSTSKYLERIKTFTFCVLLILLFQISRSNLLTYAIILMLLSICVAQMLNQVEC